MPSARRDASPHLWLRGKRSESERQGEASVEFLAQVMVSRNADGEVTSIRLFRSDRTESYSVKLDDTGKKLSVIKDTNTIVKATGVVTMGKVDGREEKIFTLLSFSKIEPPTFGTR